MNEPEKPIDTQAATPPKPDQNPGGPAATVPTPAHSPVKLKYPFKAGDKIVHEVAFNRRPKAADLVANFGAASLAEQELYTIAALLGVNAEDLKEMDGADYMVVQREWSVFLGL